MSRLAGDVGASSILGIAATEGAVTDPLSRSYAAAGRGRALRAPSPPPLVVDNHGRRPAPAPPRL